MKVMVDISPCFEKQNGKIGDLFTAETPLLEVLKIFGQRLKLRRDDEKLKRGMVIKVKGRILRWG